ncbi:hypothetical protein MTO96_003270 [Rhipicephalus appendiculatus]
MYRGWRAHSPHWLASGTELPSGGVALLVITLPRASSVLKKQPAALCVARLLCKANMQYNPQGYGGGYSGPPQHQMGGYGTMPQQPYGPGPHDPYAGPQHPGAYGAQHAPTFGPSASDTDDSGIPYYPDQYQYGPQGYGAQGYGAMAGQQPLSTTDYDQSSASTMARAVRKCNGEF